MLSCEFLDVHTPFKCYFPKIQTGVFVRMAPVAISCETVVSVPWITWIVQIMLLLSEKGYNELISKEQTNEQNTFAGWLHYGLAC